MSFINRIIQKTKTRIHENREGGQPASRHNTTPGFLQENHPPISYPKPQHLPQYQSGISAAPDSSYNTYPNAGVLPSPVSAKLHHGYDQSSYESIEPRQQPPQNAAASMAANNGAYAPVTTEAIGGSEWSTQQRYHYQQQLHYTHHHQQQQQHQQIGAVYHQTQGNVHPASPSSAVELQTPLDLDRQYKGGHYVPSPLGPHIELSDFEIYRTIGTGSFGRVRLVRYRQDGHYYAMKVLRKTDLVRAKQVEHVNNERAILAQARSPFIVQLLGTCQDNVNLYMVLEYVIGGELFTYLRRYRRFPSPVAKFYAAEVVLAFEYLHSLDIVYRDLKPENILLDADGNIKLTDLGFAKHIIDSTWTLCGTPDYLAPEVIQAKGYGKAVDWYSLGVLIFEMIAGYPPFYDEDHYKLYEKILSGRVQWPPSFDPLAHDLVKRLLSTDLSKRYGNLKGGTNDIKEHPWFQEVDWGRLARREIPAPLIPAQKQLGDTGNFDQYPETHEIYGDYVTPDAYREKFVSF